MLIDGVAVYTFSFDGDNLMTAVDGERIQIVPQHHLRFVGGDIACIGPFELDRFEHAPVGEARSDARRRGPQLHITTQSPPLDRRWT